MEKIYKELNTLLIEHWEQTYSSYAKTLRDAVLYSLKAGGKRFRPMLAYAVWRNFSSDNVEKIIPMLSAIESIHTYSLIHDDLPAMDNDVLRRGKPTNHVVYGEGLAILAGDALLTVAFKEMTSLVKYFAPDELIKAIDYLSRMSGMSGMLAGQVLDLENDATDKVDDEYLRKVNLYKTGALIKASLVLPAILEKKEYSVLERIGENIGLAFQIVDDILSVSKTTEELGKTANIDNIRKIKTFVSIYGIELAREKAEALILQAKQDIQTYYNNSLLQDLTDLVLSKL